jgi:hypothetical protein
MRKVILIACTLLLAQSLPLMAQTTTMVSGNPTGEGNPDDITCRAPQILEGVRSRGPKVCKTNAVWAQYREDGMMVSADGTHDMPIPKNKNCQSAGGNMGGGSARGATSSITCE